MTLDEIAEEYLLRLRLDEAPEVEEYARRFPSLAEEIRNTLPALVAMEQFGLEIEQSEAGQAGWTPPKVEQVGDYRILGELGRGGMGIVYEAEQQSLRRRVALKVLPRMARDDGGLARFQREARAAASLHHTNIVPVFQVGQDGEHAYYAMQLIEGQGLDSVIRDLKKLPRQSDSDRKNASGMDASDLNLISRSEQSEVLNGLKDASTSGAGARRFYRSVAQIGYQASDALAYAHARNIVHRDIKPSNLLLDASGVVWVSDFGLAMTDEGQLTHTQDVLGTLRYMSPERFDHECDARADIYALGMTLYELLVLEPAFRAVDRLHLVKSIINEDPPAPRKFDPRVPLDLETIILKAIEKDPRDRYQTAEAMAADLRNFLNDEPIEARRIRPTEKLMRWRRRNRSLAAALTTIMALLLVILGVLSWTTFKQNELRELAEERGDSLLRNLYFSQMIVAGQSLGQRHGVPPVRLQLAQWEPSRTGNDLRNWEWYYLYGSSHREEFVSETLGNGFCWECDHSPDGKYVVHTKNGWGVQVRDAKTGAVVAEQLLGSARSVDWSPDGKKIAVGAFEDVCFILAADTLATLRRLDVPSGKEGWCVRWHPNSKWLAEVSQNDDLERKREVRIHDVETGEQLYSLRSDQSSVDEFRSLSWNHDGSRLAASGNGMTFLWKFTDRLPQVEEQFPGESACWSPDGSILAVRRSKNTSDALTGRVLAESTGSIAWTPDSKMLAVGCSDGVVRIYDLERPATRAQRLLRGHQSDIWSVSWHPDGQWLASCGLTDETIRFWNVGETDHIDYFGLEPAEYSLELSHDGTSIVSRALYRSSIYTWDINGNALSEMILPATVSAVAPSPTGKTVAASVLLPSPTLFLCDSKASGPPKEILTGRQISQLAWSPQGQLAGTTDQGEVLIWDVDGRMVHDSQGVHGRGTSIHWSPNGHRLATSGQGTSLAMWDPCTGSSLWHHAELPSEVSEIRFSRDGKRLATSHQNVLLIWDADTGRQLRAFEQVPERFNSLDWSPDDTRIVSGSPSSVSVWDVESGRVALRLDAPNRSSKVRWTPDGMRIIAGGEQIKVFDASRGYKLNRMKP